jgi:nifR3 family TIM-barrel protein
VISGVDKDIEIGGRNVCGRLLLAPMAGLTHVAFRQLVAEYGGYGLLFSEMCSAKALPAENRAVSSVFRWEDNELSRLVCQIFGSDAFVMAKAAKRIQAEGFFGVDINMGCSVAPICKQGAGAALLKDPLRAVAIVEAVRDAVSIPVFVKYRTGWTDSPEPAMDLGQRFARAGADALVFHPRVAPDRRARPPKWDYIRAVREAVSVPVFGNGEVFSQKDCTDMLQSTGCHGVALGRLALARPWIFAQWALGFQPPKDIYHHCAHRMLDLLENHFEPVNALRRYRKWIVYFSANFIYGHMFAARVRKASDISCARRAVDAFFASDPSLGKSPNRNFFQ